MYTIGDFLIQIQNAYMARKKQVDYPVSKVVVALAKILEKEGYVGKVKTETEKTGRGRIIIELLYKERIPVLSKVKLLSRPSVHHYVTKSNLSKFAGKYGISILSTSHGMMTGKQAQKAGLGGELICQVH